MINGVLAERTVKDVVPALQTNSEGLKKVLEELVKQYNGKQMELEKWKVRFPVIFCCVYERDGELMGDILQKKNSIQVVQQ